MAEGVGRQGSGGERLVEPERHALIVVAHGKAPEALVVGFGVLRIVSLAAQLANANRERHACPQRRLLEQQPDMAPVERVRSRRAETKRSLALTEWGKRGLSTSIDC